jgi:histidinol dehydrogenase
LAELRPAIAFGTESIRAADMLVGPGNAYVTEAKRQLQGVIGIDMLAGPSEVLLIADAKANPTWVALDMLAQAEHGPDSRAYMLTNDATFAQRVQDELSRITAQETALPEYLRTTTSWGAIFCLETLEQCAKFSNLLAPEHLELQVENPDTLKPHLKHYGALFMGYGTPVPYGDYMAGPNHTLPTGRTARFSGCLNPLTFLRPQSWIAAGLPAQSLASDTARFAELEGLTAHALSAQARFAPSLTV